MKGKSSLALWLLVPAMVALFALSLVALPSMQRQKPQQPKGAPIYIPEEVKKVMLAGMASREPRLDIPFTIADNIFLPAREGLHSIFFLKIKNADLGYHPVGQEQPVKKEGVVAQESQSQTPSAPRKLPPSIWKEKTIIPLAIPCSPVVIFSAWL
jgi:hypothetical protein